MMVYMLSIYSDESWLRQSAERMAEVMAAHQALERDLRAAGKFRGGGGLAPSSAAVTVRFGAGKPRVTDGPFAETKELLGGFYLLEAESVEEAVSYARRIPGVDDRAVEVRPVAHWAPA
ncbi:MAG: YciI family protein [Thermodesulfobacteriota bacterium]